MYNFLTILKLISATLVPSLLVLLVYFLFEKTKLCKLNRLVRQILIGLVFGAYSILSIQFGIQVDASVVNVGTSIPLIASFVFDGFGGVIAGFIAGIYRIIAGQFTLVEYWNRFSSGISYFLVGILGFVIRKFIYKDRTPSWFYGFIFGGAIEAFCALIIVLFSFANLYGAFELVSPTLLATIFCNAFATMVPLLILGIIEKRKLVISFKKKTLSEVFQAVLISGFVVAYIVTVTFTYGIQTAEAETSANSLINENLRDIDTDIDQNCSEKLMEKITSMRESINIESTTDELKSLMKQYSISEISIADNEGKVITSTNEKYIGYDMHDGEQSSEFCSLLGSGLYFVKQDYMATSLDENVYMRYGGAKIDGGFFFAGYNSMLYRQDYISQAYTCMKNRHVEYNGGILLTDQNGFVLCDNLGGGQYTSSYELDDPSVLSSITSSSVIQDIYINNIQCHSIIYQKNSFYIIVFVSEDDVFASSKTTILILSLIEFVVYALLFGVIYVLIEKLVVDKFEKVAYSLNEISNGNLNERISVKGSVEFDSLSKNINCTISTLEKYISDAENRMNAELELARQIQKSSLPTIFPAYPERKDFDIYASMDAAKEVGGDFYDFYLIDKNRILFLVADVSGKGIPASLFMMKTKTMLKSLIESGKRIDEAFKITNNNLCKNNDADMFVTSWMGVLDLRNGLLQYVNAGHCYPLISRKNGTFEYIKGKSNFVLAGLEDTEYDLQKMTLEVGDRLFLYTDGITESKNVNNELYGENRLKECLNHIQNGYNVREICLSVKQDVDEFSKGRPQSDDLTMLTLKVNSLGIYDSLDIEPNENSTPIIKSFIQSKGEEMNISKSTLSKILIVTDEIYSNIVKYANARTCHISLKANKEDVTLLLTENGDEFDPTSFVDKRSESPLDELEEGGLGLLIVRQISKEFTHEYKDGLNIIKVVFDNIQ